MDTLREGLQNFTCAGVLLANTHQELCNKGKVSVGERGESCFSRTAQRVGLVTYLDGFAVGLPGKIKDGENLLLLWQGHRQIEEWVKSDGDLCKGNTSMSRGLRCSSPELTQALSWLSGLSQPVSKLSPKALD